MLKPGPSIGPACSESARAVARGTANDSAMAASPWNCMQAHVHASQQNGNLKGNPCMAIRYRSHLQMPVSTKSARAGWKGIQIWSHLIHLLSRHVFHSGFCASSSHIRRRRTQAAFLSSHANATAANRRQCATLAAQRLGQDAKSNCWQPELSAEAASSHNHSTPPVFKEATRRCYPKSRTRAK
jgi:hypothetical protein